MLAQDRYDGIALLDHVNAIVGRIAAGDLIFRLRQQRDIFRHHPGFKAGIGVGGGALGSVGQFKVGRRAGGIRRRVGKGITDAATAAPVRGIAHPHQYLVERDHGGELRLRQDRRKILGDERNLGIRLNGVGKTRIVAGGWRRGADVGQHTLGVVSRDFGAEIAGRQRQIARDANIGPHPHDVAVADAGDGGDPDHILGGGGIARRRQAIALVQAGRAVVGAERAAERAFHPFRHLGKGHLAVQRRENGAANQGRAAQAGQNGSAEPLHRDAAAVDHRSLGAVDGKRRLVPEIDHADLTAVATTA